MPKILGRTAHLSLGSDRIGTLTSKTLAINNSPIDVTAPPVSGSADELWSESMSGLHSITISGDGVFADSAGEAALRTAAGAANGTATLTLDFPRWGSLSGTWRIESVEYMGETEDAVRFSISLASVGAITFTRNVDLYPSRETIIVGSGNRIASVTYRLWASVAPTARVAVSLDYTSPVTWVTLNPASRVEFSAGQTSKNVVVNIGRQTWTREYQFTITHGIHTRTNDARFTGMVINPTIVRLTT